ncbi:MAG TPA: HAD family phosphatase [bacterium]|nr:HAD family phosphatase [bacterium]
MKPTVFFDLGNVLVDVDKKKALQIFARELQVSMQSLLDFPESKLEKDFETGHIDTEEYIKQLHDYFNLDNRLTHDNLREIWKKPFTINNYSIEILEKVKEQAPTFLLSNTNPLHIEAIEEKYPDLLGIFDDLIFSFTAGSSKPDQQIYHFALKKADAEPDQALFIDDLEENITAAQKIGLKAHQFISPQSMKEFLKSNKINL